MDGPPDRGARRIDGRGRCTCRRRGVSSTGVSSVSVSVDIGIGIRIRIGIGVGFAGALSTLSMLARQLGEMVESGEFVLAVKYGVGTALAAIAASAVGVYGFG